MHYLSKDNHTTNHGFLIGGRALAEISTKTTATEATLVLGVTFDGSDLGYPFVIEVNISYTLHLKGGLTVVVSAKNVMSGGLPAPFMAGFHPYFKLINSDFSTSKIVLDKRTRWNRQLQLHAQVPNGLTVPFTVSELFAWGFF